MLGISGRIHNQYRDSIQPIPESNLHGKHNPDGGHWTIKNKPHKKPQWMEYEYRSIGGVLLPYPTSSKSLLHIGAPSTNQKAGVQRHNKSTNPITRTSPQITDERRRLTKPKPRKGIRSRSFLVTTNNQPQAQHSAKNPTPNG